MLTWVTYKLPLGSHSGTENVCNLHFNEILYIMLLKQLLKVKFAFATSRLLNFL